jgi:ATP-dependent helicase HrpB
LRDRLDQLAPTHIEVPTGSKIALDYLEGQPRMSVRLQEVFGWPECPTIADGRVRVVLQLLSPARRPIQTTADLGGFWRGSYAQVRGEMRGRYPKHDWPEDPTSARPTRGAKKRPSAS